MLSRFYNRMDNDTLRQFDTLMKVMRKIVYTIKRPEFILLDLDSTLLSTYGKEEGEGFNYHYQEHGYHPLVCYDGLTGDLLKILLRDGTAYSSNDVADFLRPLLEELSSMEFAPELSLRGDSGFATPELYELCEYDNYKTSYAIRLKMNSIKGTFEDKRECSIRKYQVSGTTVETPVFYSDEKNRYLHIYYSYGKATSEREALESRLDRMAAYLGRLEGQPVVVDKSYEKYYSLEYFHEGQEDQCFVCVLIVK